MNLLSLSNNLTKINRPISGIISEFNMSMEKRSYTWVRRHGRAILEFRYSLYPEAFNSFLKYNPGFELHLILSSDNTKPYIYSVSPIKIRENIPAWYFLSHKAALKLIGIDPRDTINIQEQYLDTMSMLIL